MAKRKAKHHPAYIRFTKLIQVNKDTGCYEWQGVKDDKGYGTFKYRSKMWKAHRFMMRLMGTKLTVNTRVLHKCGNPGCVNPMHLSIVKNVKETRSNGGNS